MFFPDLNSANLNVYHFSSRIWSRGRDLSSVLEIGHPWVNFSIGRFGRAVEVPKMSSLYHKETRGTSDDSDENTPIDEVKGPNFFERVKEEL
ncbi:hypothetical protein AKJ16_DCAP14985 [Drosera capensis]